MSTPSRVPLAIAHDYLTVRGGAERVVLAMHRAFPQAPIYTTLYHPEGTFPEFVDADVRVSPLNHVGPLRRNHRAALPLLAPAASAMHVDAEVTLVSSTGWAHGFRTTGRTLVYCHSPARFLYLRRQYLGQGSRLSPQALVLGALRPGLLRWDRRAARRADRYLANSTIVAERIARAYGIEARILFPPGGMDPLAGQQAVPQVEDWAASGYHLLVSRLMPYKNIDAALGAFAALEDERLVVIGRGPLKDHLVGTAPPNVRFLEGLEDSQMRWAYAHATALLAPSFEDFGLTPLEAYSFGKPVLALRGGGYLDTVRDGDTGLFFSEPTPSAIADAVHRGQRVSWDREAITTHGAAFSESRFAQALRDEISLLRPASPEA